MYVPKSGPLPQNSLMPPPAEDVAREARRMRRLALSVAAARAEYACIPSPESFAEFGRNVVNDVRHTQTTLNLTGTGNQTIQSLNASDISKAAALDNVVGKAPKVVPLNGVAVVPTPPAPTLTGPVSRVTAPWGDSALRFDAQNCAPNDVGMQIWKPIAVIAAIGGMLALAAAQRRRF